MVVEPVSAWKKGQFSTQKNVATNYKKTTAAASVSSNKSGSVVEPVNTWVQPISVYVPPVSQRRKITPSRSSTSTVEATLAHVANTFEANSGSSHTRAVRVLVPPTVGLHASFGVTNGGDRIAGAGFNTGLMEAGVVSATNLVPTHPEVATDWLNAENIISRPLAFGETAEGRGNNPKIVPRSHKSSCDVQGKGYARCVGEGLSEGLKVAGNIARFVVRDGGCAGATGAAVFGGTASVRLYLSNGDKSWAPGVSGNIGAAEGMFYGYGGGPTWTSERPQGFSLGVNQCAEGAFVSGIQVCGSVADRDTPIDTSVTYSPLGFGLGGAAEIVGTFAWQS